MVRYITLIQFTDEGAKAIRKSTNRAHAFSSAAAKAGVTIEAQYWTMGTYDGVLIINAENATKALHCLTDLAASGTVRTVTMQAFVDREFDAIVGK